MRLVRALVATTATALLSAVLPAWSSEIHPAIQAAIDHPDRPAADRKRDATREPGKVLEFFGVRSGMTLLEVFAADGFTAEILSRAVGPNGKVYMQNPAYYYERWGADAVTERLANGRLPNVVRLDAPLNEMKLPPASLDGAVMNLVFHDFFWLSDDVPDVLADVYAALKPGGFVGVLDHAAPAGTGAEFAKSRDGQHRIDEDFARRMFLDAGFVLEDESQMMRHPEDDRTRPFYAPELRGKQTDRFMLRFRKPR